MTDFKSWLEGFLEGKETLDKEQIDLIRAKAQEYPPVSVPSVWRYLQPTIPTFTWTTINTGDPITIPEPEVYC